jgi:hypothetical protein
MVGGSGKHPDLLDTAGVSAESIADPVAESFLVVVLADGDGQIACPPPAAAFQSSDMPQALRTT